MEVRQELLRDPEVTFESSRLLIGIEGSSFPDNINLRRLEATKDDSARLREHTLSPIEAQTVSLSYERLWHRRFLGAHSPYLGMIGRSLP
jgi:hypothetical protein